MRANSSWVRGVAMVWSTSLVEHMIKSFQHVKFLIANIGDCIMAHLKMIRCRERVFWNWLMVHVCLVSLLMDNCMDNWHMNVLWVSKLWREFGIRDSILNNDYIKKSLAIFSIKCMSLQNLECFNGCITRSNQSILLRIGKEVPSWFQSRNISRSWEV